MENFTHSRRPFLELDGFQCGYCTPRQICSATGMADELNRCCLCAINTSFSRKEVKKPSFN
nr:2Fe-2S iron-sulfur cluster-binding protein [Edaphobacter lichenicola]